MTSENPIKLKILLIGSSAVGKSTLLKQFVSDEFDDNINPTIGVDFTSKNVVLNNIHLCLKLWDTAGSEKFQSLTPSYYRKAQGVILVYDVTRKSTFNDLQNWLNECNLYLEPSQCVKILVGNKIDLNEERVIDRQEGIEFARKHSMLFIEASAKTSEGVAMAFDELLLKILDTPHLYQSSADAMGSNLEVSNSNNIMGCCF